MSNFTSSNADNQRTNPQQMHLADVRSSIANALQTQVEYNGTDWSPTEESIDAVIAAFTTPAQTLQASGTFGAQPSSGSYDYTDDQIAAMSPAEFRANRPKINQAARAGRIQTNRPNVGQS
jgi:hypothetical protein